MGSATQALTVYLNTITHNKSPQALALLAEPETLINMASMPFDRGNTLSSFCTLITNLGKIDPQRAGTCLQVAANLAINPMHHEQWPQKQIKDVFTAMMAISPHWDFSLEGAEKRWQGLSVLAGGDAQWGEIMAKMQAGRLDLNTPSANHKRNAPRL